MRDLARIRPYLKPHLVLMGGAVLASLLLAIVDVPLPFFIKHIIDDVLRTRPRRSLFGFDLSGIGPIDLLNVIFGLLVVTALLKGFLVYLQRIMTERVGQRVVYEMRKDLFRHLQGLNLLFFRESSTGRIMLRFVGDIQSVLDLITDGVMRVLMDSATVVAILVCLVAMNPHMTLITLCFVPVYVWPFVRWGERIRDASHRARDSRAHLSGNLQEKIAGIGVVKAFSQEGREQTVFEDLSADVRDNAVDRAHWSGKLNGAAQAAIALCAAFILWQGALYTMEPGMTRGQLMAFYMLAALLFAPLRRLARVSETYQNAMVSLERIHEFLDSTARGQERDGARPLLIGGATVTFERVTFCYPEGNPVLQDLSLRVPAGTVVALVGPNGAGKTTLVSLIPRFFELNDGKILIDGQDIRDVTLASLRERIAIVSQDTLLFSGTIGENIAYGRPDATEAEIVAAARVAKALGFIEEHRRGLNRRVGERGAKLSGGQRQRIAIARAVLRDPAILILDEATSSVDSGSEAEIRDALNQLMAGRTTFVVAHRVSTVQRADMIILLDQGRIVASGTHADLMRESEAYRRLCGDQLIVDVPAEMPGQPGILAAGR
ncbi:MAG TPA: ABC transporter ATP-binding protein [Candidatus Polarisedimenticolaceae bacterium]|nr:ABC transporter ATP-binding protein [Candidatus Polarisedimenticolaceae bacterium]